MTTTMMFAVALTRFCFVGPLRCLMIPFLVFLLLEVDGARCMFVCFFVICDVAFLRIYSPLTLNRRSAKGEECSDGDLYLIHYL